MKLSFMTANYVARELNYTNSHDWMACHHATVAAFHGPQFESKFEQLVSDVKQLGFDALELWVAHLEPFEANSSMVDKARSILDSYGIKAVSYTAGFGRPGVTREEAVRVFETAQAVGASVLAQGFHPDNGSLIAPLAEQYKIRVGLENHPEKTPQEVIGKIAPFTPWVGSAIDTGWFGSQGYDAVKAVDELLPYLVHVHLKDVLGVGSHESCALGDGVVNCKGVLAALKSANYEGYVTIEHEPHDRDPSDEVRISLQRVKSWLNESE